MVANIQVRSVRRVRWDSNRDEERIEVAGSIGMVGRQTAYPAGSFQLRTLSEIIFTPKTRTRGVLGSVSSPSILGNTVLIIPTILGTTGTRLTSLATIGSVPASGTVTASFVAWGY